MPDLTPQNQYPIPSEFEEPYFETAKSYFLATDMADWALAESQNTIWSGGSVFFWNATSGLLSWSAPIEIRYKTTVWKGIIQGPPAPGGQAVLQDGESVFFQQPRLMSQDTTVSLKISPIIQIPGVRLHDISILATRIGTTVFFPNGKSLKHSESGILFGAGSGVTTLPHEHQPAREMSPSIAGEYYLDLNISSFSPAVLVSVQLYRNGGLQHTPDDYVVDFGTGIVTLVVPTLRPTPLDPVPERFIALMETTPPITTTGEHDHLAPRVIDPAAGTVLLDMLVTSLDYPALTKVDLYRNGILLSEPDDYSMDFPAGLATLTTPSVTGERFTALREVQY